MATEQDHFRNITALWHEAQQSGGSSPAPESTPDDSGRISGKLDGDDFDSIKGAFEKTSRIKPGHEATDTGAETDDAPGTELSVIVESMIRERLHGEFGEMIRATVREEVAKHLAESESSKDEDDS